MLVQIRGRAVGLPRRHSVSSVAQGKGGGAPQAALSQFSRPVLSGLPVHHQFPGGASGKESAYQCRRLQRQAFSLRVRKIPWRRKWQPALVFLPGKFHGQRAWRAAVPGVTESDVTEHIYIHKRVVTFFFHLMARGVSHAFIFGFIVKHAVSFHDIPIAYMSDH